MRTVIQTLTYLVYGPDPEQCLQTKVPDYALLFFDHLYSEYLTLKSQINDHVLLASIKEKRDQRELTWSDIYAFDLALIDVRPLENLIRKAYDARSRYRSIAGQKEYDEYIASRPPDLAAILLRPDALKSGTEQNLITSPPMPPPVISSPPTEEPEQQALQNTEIVQRLLRADIRYLLNKFYLYYAMLPLRECLRDQLTSQAVRVTVLSLIAFGIFLALSFGVGASFLTAGWKDIINKAALGLTLAAVVFFGILGGCVSMLQRIQSVPTEGDALFNLASIGNGWRGLSLSPLYGGIFATILFIMFAAGILQGSVFPKIGTAAGQQILINVHETATPAPVAGASSQTASVANPTATTTPTDTQKTGVLQLKDFLTQTGPQEGGSFALLMIWSFIAGFAERFVPDTLNRLVTKTEAIQGTNK